MGFLLGISGRFNITFEQLEFKASGKTPSDTCDVEYVCAFEIKLWLWEGQLEKFANYAHFATLQENKPTSSTWFFSVIQHLRTDFSFRFDDIRSLKQYQIV